jgi:hypothetical protein
MIRTVEMSRAKKTAGIAVTYRAGQNDMFGTCPANCNLNDSGKGAKNVDNDYLDALLNAKPKKGFSFTYSHFHWSKWIEAMRKVRKTVINYSADAIDEALKSFAANIPTVMVFHNDQWHGNKSIYLKLHNYKLKEKNYVPVLRCPAEYRNISCNDCGNGEPLCARMNRKFIIGFTAHGPNKRKAASKTEQGGCYGAQGNCRIWWNDTAKTEQPDETDGQKLLRFVKSLPVRSIIRHHVAGDIGANL